ncbi:hypothetical protein PN435_21330, partial [Nodularia spumigena CS-590/02]|nr:hypothetical protein [Nodularia spumigena CS-590/02]
MSLHNATSPDLGKQKKAGGQGAGSGGELEVTLHARLLNKEALEEGAGSGGELEITLYRGLFNDPSCSAP